MIYERRTASSLKSDQTLIWNETCITNVTKRPESIKEKQTLGYPKILRLDNTAHVYETDDAYLNVAKLATYVRLQPIDIQ